MEKKIRSKLKIVLITAGALIACTAALIGAILIAGNAEENKIVKTAYKGNGVKVANVDVVEAASTKAEDISSSALLSQDETMLSADNISHQNIAIEEIENETADQPETQTNPPQEVKDGEIEEPGNTDQEQISITEDEAKATMIEYLKNLFDVKVKESSLTASLETTTIGVKHKYWYVRYEDFDCSIDAISGEVMILWGRYDYEGDDNNSTYSFSNRNSDESYYKKTEEIVNEHLADGHEIELIYIDGVQDVYNDQGTAYTLLVDCHVLMKSGPSYTLSLIGSEQELYWYSSHPTQKACVWMYYWEEDGAEYPDFIPYKDGDEIIYSPYQD